LTQVAGNAAWVKGKGGPRVTPGGWQRFGDGGLGLERVERRHERDMPGVFGAELAARSVGHDGAPERALPQRSAKRPRTCVWSEDCAGTTQPFSEEGIVLWTIFIILLVLWLLGLVSGYTLGGFLHILLLIALVVIIIRVIQGRRPI
jgi:hypothetical protein